MSRRRMLMGGGYYPQINMDITNGSYTVPYGYTRCVYTLMVTGDGGVEAHAAISAGAFSDSITSYYSETRYGEFAVIAGTIIYGDGYGGGSAYITLT